MLKVTRGRGCIIIRSYPLFIRNIRNKARPRISFRGVLCGGCGGYSRDIASKSIPKVLRLIALGCCVPQPHSVGPDAIGPEHSSKLASIQGSAS